VYAVDKDRIAGPANDFVGKAESGDQIVTDDSPLAPFAYEGLDPLPEPKSSIAEATGALKAAVRRLNSAIAAGRKPGMPLSILSNIAREAPLGSLLCAFLLGVAIGRRR
jgi:hypothetical protein